MRTAAAKTPAGHRNVYHVLEAGVVTISPATEVSIVQESTPARVTAACRALKRAMPKAASASAVRQREEMWP